MPKQRHIAKQDIRKKKMTYSKSINGLLGIEHIKYKPYPVPDGSPVCAMKSSKKRCHSSNSFLIKNISDGLSLKLKSHKKDWRKERIEEHQNKSIFK